MIGFNEIEEARERIKDYIYKTPLEKSLYLSSDSTNIFLKLENQQKMKCAKVRGAFSMITALSPEEVSKGIVAISSGNHGASVSYATSLLGIKNTTIYVPKLRQIAKLKRLSIMEPR